MIDLSGTKGELGFDIQSLINTIVLYVPRLPANAIEIVEVDVRNARNSILTNAFSVINVLKAAPEMQ